MVDHRYNACADLGRGWHTGLVSSLAPYFGTRTFEICWPRELVVAELDRLLALADAHQPLTHARRSSHDWQQQCDHFFREVFTSSVAVQEWELAQQSSTKWDEDPWGPGSATGGGWGSQPETTRLAGARDWLKALRLHADVLPPQQARKPYWSERHNQRPGSDTLTLGGVARRVGELVHDLTQLGYLAWAVGEMCVDGDWDGQLGSDPAEEIHRLLGRDGLWPIPAHCNDYSLDDLCDVVEFLADHVRRPMTSRIHSYGGCGLHFDDFDPVQGLRVYRWRTNTLLAQSDLGLVLDEDGRLEKTAPETVEDLVTEVRARTATVHAVDANEIAHALSRFRHRGASALDRRHAVIALAGVLERRRALVKQELLRKDEGALFQLANEFGVRHQNANQRTDYDEQPYLEWIFYWYLATINLTDRIISGQDDMPQLAGGPLA
jgi:hypothetical protein